MSALFDMFEKYKPTAQFSGDVLVLSLPDAKTPVVWRMELSDKGMSAVEVEEQGGVYTLLMKKGKTSQEKIAEYDNRDSAMRALVVLTRALERAPATVQYQSAPAANAPATAHEPVTMVQKPDDDLSLGKMVLAVLGIVVVAYLALELFAPDDAGDTVSAVSMPSNLTSNSGSVAKPATVRGIESGVPLDADAILNRKK